MLAVTKLYLLDRRYDEFVLRYTTLWVELTSKKRVARLNSKWWIFILSPASKHDLASTNVSSYQ